MHAHTHIYIYIERFVLTQAHRLKSSGTSVIAEQAVGELRRYRHIPRSIYRLGVALLTQIYRHMYIYIYIYTRPRVVAELVQLRYQHDGQLCRSKQITRCMYGFGVALLT